MLLLATDCLNYLNTPIIYLLQKLSAIVILEIRYSLTHSSLSEYPSNIIWSHLLESKWWETKTSISHITYNTSFTRVGALPGAWFSAKCSCVRLTWPTTRPDSGLDRVDVGPLWNGSAVCCKETRRANHKGFRRHKWQGSVHPSFEQKVESKFIPKRQC